jgi:hypothetical protein
MKMFFRLSLLLCFCLVLQGSGYVGDLPNINEYFQADRDENASNTFIDMYKPSQTLIKPPALDAESLKKQLAPANYTNAQIKLLRPAKKPAYYDDLLELKPYIAKLKDATIKSPNVQAYSACINIQKFYLDNFLEKYKNAPEAKQDVYMAIKDIDTYAQAVAQQWNASAENIKFVSYSSFNGAYQPVVIKEKLNTLDKKLDRLIKLMDAVE